MEMLGQSPHTSSGAGSNHSCYAQSSVPYVWVTNERGKTFTWCVCRSGVWLGLRRLSCKALPDKNNNKLPNVLCGICIWWEITEWPLETKIWNRNRVGKSVTELCWAQDTGTGACNSSFTRPVQIRGQSLEIRLLQHSTLVIANETIGFSSYLPIGRWNPGQYSYII